MRFLFLRVISKKIRSLVLDCLSSFVILFSSRGIIPLHKMDWQCYEIVQWKIDSFQLYGPYVYSSFPVLLELHQSVPEWIRRLQRDFLLSIQYSGLTAAFLNQMNPILIKEFFRLSQLNRCSSWAEPSVRRMSPLTRSSSVT